MNEPTETSPLPPPDPHLLPPPSTDAPQRPDQTAPIDRPRARRRWWIGAIVVLAIIIGASAVYALLDRTVLRHDLLEADFQRGAGAFREGATSDYDFKVTGTAYRIRAVSTPSSPASAFANFRRIAYNVDIKADVVAVTGFGPDTGVGIGCGDKPISNGHGYEFDVSSRGYRIVRIDGADVSLIGSVPEAVTLTATPLELRITCSPSTGGHITVRGYLNGAEVIQASDPKGLTTFRSALLVLEADTAGQSATFDNVVAVVPGE